MAADMNSNRNTAAHFPMCMNSHKMKKVDPTPIKFHPTRLGCKRTGLQNTLSISTKRPPSMATSPPPIPNPMDSPSNPNPTAAVSTTTSRVCRGWNDLGHDLLLSILQRISPLDLVADVYAVCSSWRAVARDPVCWRSVDLSDWEAVTARFGADVSFAQVVRRIAAFSHGGACIRRLYFPRSATGQDFVFVSERLPNLIYLSLPIPEILENEFSIALPRFKYLTGLAVDQYYGFSLSLLYLLKENFPNLAEFKLFDLDERLEHQDAMIISHHLPNLQKLELPIRISRQAVLVFLRELRGLEYLDISGYQNSVINKEILEKASGLKVFIWHSGQELGEFVACLNCGGNEGIPPCQCVVGEKMMELLASP